MLITIPNPGTISFDFGSSVLTSGVDVVELVDAVVEVSVDFTSSLTEVVVSVV